MGCEALLEPFSPRHPVAVSGARLIEKEIYDGTVRNWNHGGNSFMLTDCMLGAVHGVGDTVLTPRTLDCCTI